MANKLGFAVLVNIHFLISLRALGPLRLLSRFQGLRVRSNTELIMDNVTVHSHPGVLMM